MTEPIAICSFTLTKKSYYEATMMLHRDKSGKLIKIMFGVLAALWLAFAVYAVWRGEGLALILLELLALIVAFLWAAVLIPRGKAKRTWAKVTDPERTATFYGDRLELTTGERELTVDYADVANVLTSKNLTILITADHNGIILDRSGYTGGDEKTVLSAIEKIREEESDD